MSSIISTASSADPVASMTLKVTSSDASRFESIVKSVAEGLETKDEKDAEDSAAAALHQRLYRAVQASPDPQVVAFWERFQATMIPAKELKAGLLLLHRSEENKLDSAYQALAVGDLGMDKRQCQGLFRAFLTAITCCIQANDVPSPSSSPKDADHSVVVEGKPSGSCCENGGGEPPRKRAKTEGPPPDFKTACQSPSFDSSLATLRDEDEATTALRKEIDQISLFAAEKLTTDHPKVALKAFKDWCSSDGHQIVPWIDLLDHSKWKLEESVQTQTPKPCSDKQASTDGDLPTPPDVTSSSSEVQLSKQAQSQNSSSPNPPPDMPQDSSQVMVSFDFTGADHPVPLCINITQDNLFALRHLLHRTGIMHMSCIEAGRKILKSRTPDGDKPIVLKQADFPSLVSRLWSQDIWKYLPDDEKQCFNDSMLSILGCFRQSKDSLLDDEIDLHEFVVGSCFFCAGNKSQKLATGFELLDHSKSGVLSEERLATFLKSHLLMLASLSLLRPIAKGPTTGLSEDRRKAMRSAIESGAKWTLGHFLQHVRETEPNPTVFSFETFANWYSVKGYNVAPWLELLDLGKVLALIAPALESPIQLPQLPTSGSAAPNSAPKRSVPRDRMSSLRRHHSSRRHGGPPPEVLFTFPLAGARSLIVLREDANYVKTVVDKMDLLRSNPDALWKTLTRAVNRRQATTKSDTTYVAQQTFVDCMKDVCPDSETGELIRNFYQCFDLEQTDSVALDELMGGLTLLCGGKKSAKLAFAFGIFDTRPGIKKKKNVTHSLSGEDLFLFLRSILIVTFSCCRQSLDLADAVVSRCICDTANMICNDVMRHQWEKKHVDRLDFDEFGQWYNEGGFDRAPWLELLDLKKWVLSPPLESKILPMTSFDTAIPPPPPEDSLDPGFFDDAGIMNMDSMDEMDMIFMQGDKDDPRSPKLSASFSFSSRSPPSESRGNPLKFHLLTHEEHGGYMMSMSNPRITQLRHLLEDVGMYKLDTEKLCNAILKSASKANKLTKTGFDTAIRKALKLSEKKIQSEYYKTMSSLLSGIFDAFDRDGDGTTSAIEVACGLTVLCAGKKSDKLEFAFEVLDKKKKGRLNRNDISSYLRSFLTVLLSIAFSPFLKNDSRFDTITTMKGTSCSPSTTTVIQAVKAGATWACESAFESKKHDKKAVLTFDDFAEWYTTKGYSSIPWLELLDLRKWVFTADTE